MALIKEVVYNAGRCSGYKSFFNGFHTTSMRSVDQSWRIKNRLTENPNAFGPLTNMSDYSFKDGRVTPLGVKQLIRLNKHQEYTKRIITLVSQIDYAVKRYDKLQLEENERRQKILESKLKPKGKPLMLTKPK
ncbi:39S ribosomal protein L52, mitochondrial [Orussus abietinus]|uniref:39S ribosomal protein L52, mitochondrial n=1 Tax=Orussus abietinus TaxID=222816 RepID=UPI000626CCF0|nr:39S ribosomal protein L52, mitochondrial [Orussus abietinus]